MTLVIPDYIMPPQLEDGTATTDELDSVLGSPISQKIVRFLSVHSQLSVKELVELTNLSESQIHLILNKMTDCRLVDRYRKGIYQLSNEPFAKSLKEAYLTKLIELINNETYIIHRKLREGRFEDARERFQTLARLYQPLLRTRFQFIMSGLAHDFIDRKIEQKQFS